MGQSNFGIHDIVISWEEESDRIRQDGNGYRQQLDPGFILPGLT